MIPLQPDDPWTRALSTCVDATRVLVFRHLQDDQYVIIEGGEVSLSDSATLKQMINDLSRRNT